MIENIGFKHAGIYQCFASNDLGTVFSSAEVYVSMGNKSIDSDYDDYEGKKIIHIGSVILFFSYVYTYLSK